MNIARLSSLIMFSLCFALGANAATYYVDAENGNDLNDGSSATMTGEANVGPKQTWLAIKEMLKNGEIASGSTLSFAPGRYVTGGVYTNNLAKLTFVGTGTDRSQVVFDGEGTGGFLTVQVENTDVFRNLTVSNCFATAKSGDCAPGLAIAGNPTIDTCAFFCCTNASTTGKDRGTGADLSWGGAIRLWKSGTVTNTLFMYNHAKYGGAVASGMETTSLCYYYDCDFISNTCFYIGGAITQHGSAQLTKLVHCNFIGNGATAVSGGGGALNGTISATNCLFRRNWSNDTGGAWRQPAFAYVKDCTFEDNTSVKGGGAIWASGNYGQNLALCRFYRNRGGSGGAICLNGSPALLASVKNCEFINNRATTGDGGAIFGTIAHMDNCLFLTNVCALSGAAWCNGLNSYDEVTIKLKKEQWETFDWVVSNCLFVAHSNAVPRSNTTFLGGTVNLKASFFQKFVDCIFNDNIFDVNGSMSANQGNYEGGVVYAGWDAGFDRCGFTNNFFTCGHGTCFAGVSTSGVRRCSFVNNRASLETGLDYRDSSGGALFFYNTETGSPTAVAGITNIVEDCEFLRNSVKGVGGAAIASMFGALKVKDCVFRGNYNDPTGVWTGCKRSGTILVYGYLTKNTGKCLNSWNTLDTEIDGCLFEDDDTCGRGGAINLSDTQYNSTFVQGAATVRNCLFKGCDIKSTLNGSDKGANSGWGGAICCGTQKVEIANCTFMGLSGVKGGAIYAALNAATGSSATTVTNCVFYNNSDTQKSSTTFDTCNIAEDHIGYCYAKAGGTIAAGNGNIISDADPFMADDHCGYAVKTACGRAAGLVLDWMMADTLDLGGKPRVVGGTVDFGCYQYWRKPGLMIIVR